MKKVLIRLMWLALFIQLMCLIALFVTGVLALVVPILGLWIVLVGLAIGVAT